MKFIGKSRLYLTALPLGALVAGCSDGTFSSFGGHDNAVAKIASSPTQIVRALPPWLHARSERSSRPVLAPAATRKGIYVTAFASGVIEGFSIAGKGPRCQTYTGHQSAMNDIAVDPRGDLIVPLGGSESVSVYGGPNMCGPEVGSFSDPYGQPSNAASMNALKGTIAVANIVGPGSSAGNIAICTLKSGCTKELTNSNVIGYAGGIALAKNGDCWLTSDLFYSYYISPPTMTYWKGCTGSGEAVTGYQNSAYGSISIDSHGYLVSLDLGSYYQNSQLWVYKGCNPQCKLVGGPFPLQGREVFGGLNKKSNEYGVTVYEGDSYPNTMTDIYEYTPTSIKYKFSFPNDLGGYDPEGFAFSPSPKL